MEWPELVPFLFQLIQQGTVDDHICVLHMLATMPELLSKADLSPIFQFLIAQLDPSLPKLLTVNAIHTLVSIYTECPKVLSNAHMSQAVALMWKAIKTISIEDMSESYYQCLESLIKLAEYAPKSMREIIPDMIATALTIINDADIDEGASIYLSLACSFSYLTFARCETLVRGALCDLG